MTACLPVLANQLLAHQLPEHQEPARPELQLGAAPPALPPSTPCSAVRVSPAVRRLQPSSRHSEPSSAASTKSAATRRRFEFVYSAYKACSKAVRTAAGEKGLAKKW